MPDPRAPRDRPLRALRPASRASRARSGRRTRRSSRARRGRADRTTGILVHEFCVQLRFSRGSRSPVRAIAWRRSARSLVESFTPGADSTPDDTSMAYGRTVSMARATLSAFRPPERMTGRCPGDRAGSVPVDRRARCRRAGPDRARRAGRWRRREQPPLSAAGRRRRRRHRLDHAAWERGIASTRLVAVELDRAEPELGGDVRHSSGGWSTNTPTAVHERRQRLDDGVARSGLDETRALRPEDEADRVGAELRRLRPRPRRRRMPQILTLDHAALPPRSARKRGARDRAEQSAARRRETRDNRARSDG